MIRLEVVSDLVDRPCVRRDGTVEFRLAPGMLVISNQDTKLAGPINSMEALLRGVRVGDRVSVSGHLETAGVARAEWIHIESSAGAARSRRA